jgi:hypothetical protein
VLQHAYVLAAYDQPVERARYQARVGVVVDALDDAARSFYLHHEFMPLLDHPNRLFVAMATIERAFRPR